MTQSSPMISDNSAHKKKTNREETFFHIFSHFHTQSSSVRARWRVASNAKNMFNETTGEQIVTAQQQPPRRRNQEKVETNVKWAAAGKKRRKTICNETIFPPCFSFLVWLTTVENTFFVCSHHNWKTKACCWTLALNFPLERLGESDDNRKRERAGKVGKTLIVEHCRVECDAEYEKKRKCVKEFSSVKLNEPSKSSSFRSALYFRRQITLHADPLEKNRWGCLYSQLQWCWCGARESIRNSLLDYTRNIAICWLLSSFTFMWSSAATKKKTKIRLPSVEYTGSDRERGGSSWRNHEQSELLWCPFWRCKNSVSRRKSERVSSFNLACSQIVS